MPRSSAMVLPFRHRLLSVFLFGIVTSALSIVALFRILSLTTTYRIERGRHEVTEELASLARASAGARAQQLTTPASWLIGMHGGYVDDAGAMAAIPAALAARVGPILSEAMTNQRESLVAAEGEAGVFVTGARPARGGGYAWADYVVRRPAYLDSWRKIAIALALATSLLVTTAIASTVAVKRSAQALNRSLAAIGDNREVPVERPTIRELGEVADGIGRLATRLAEARRTEERLAADLARQERLAALGRVVAGVAHEVRNPLASIKLRLDLTAEQHPAVPDGVKQALAHATKEISRLDRLVADLLTVAGRPVGTLYPVSLGELARNRVAAMAPWAESRGVHLVATGEAHAEADPDALGRALDNLLRNAVEASPRGDTVEVDVARASAKVISTPAPDAATGAGEARPPALSPRVQIRIADRGPGVPEAQAAQLFEPFFTTKAEGTGLGLPICRAVVRAHGGEITYDRQDAVTRFIIDLPGLAAGLPASRAVRTSPAVAERA